MSLENQPAARISIGRILTTAFAALGARFADIMAIGAIFLLLPAVLLGFAPTDSDTGVLWLVLVNLPVLVFEGAAIRLLHGAMVGAPPAAPSEALRAALTRLSHLFSIFALTIAPLLLSVGLLNAMGQAALLVGAPLVAAAAVTLSLLWIVAPPLVMLEDAPAFKALALSVRLTRGNRVRLFAVVLIVGGLGALSLAVGFGTQALVAQVAAADIAQRISVFVAQPLANLAIEPMATAVVTATYVELRRGTPATPA